MAESVSYLACGFCDLSADPADTHCISCGGNLDQNDYNDILLALVTQVNAVLARKTKVFLGTRRELKMSFVTGVLCTLWMFSCLIIVNMQSFGVAVFGSDTAIVLQATDTQESYVLEPSLRGALEGK